MYRNCINWVANTSLISRHFKPKRLSDRLNALSSEAAFRLCLISRLIRLFAAAHPECFMLFMFIALMEGKKQSGEISIICIGLQIQDVAHVFHKSKMSAFFNASFVSDDQWNYWTKTMNQPCFKNRDMLINIAADIQCSESALKHFWHWFAVKNRKIQT